METSLRSYQKRLLRRHLNITEKFLDRDNRAARIAKRFLTRLEQKIKRYQKWKILSDKKEESLLELLNEIEERI